MLMTGSLETLATLHSLCKYWSKLGLDADWPLQQHLPIRLQGSSASKPLQQGLYSNFGATQLGSLALMEQQSNVLGNVRG